MLKELYHSLRGRTTLLKWCDSFPMFRSTTWLIICYNKGLLFCYKLTAPKSVSQGWYFNNDTVLWGKQELTTICDLSHKLYGFFSFSFVILSISLLLYLFCKISTLLQLEILVIILMLLVALFYLRALSFSNYHYWVDHWISTLTLHFK